MLDAYICYLLHCRFLSDYYIRDRSITYPMGLGGWVFIGMVHIKFYVRWHVDVMRKCFLNYLAKFLDFSYSSHPFHMKSVSLSIRDSSPCWDGSVSRNIASM